MSPSKSSSSKPLRPVVLIIMDGWGIAPPGRGNAVVLANTPTISSISAAFPHTRLQASGEWVGLPRGEDGNSEVGHLNLGAGRIVYQDLPRINLAIADGTFLRNEALLKAVSYARERSSRVHLLGLTGLGGVHSSLEHLYALLWLCKENGLRKDQILLHVFADGRDCPPTAGPMYISEIEHRLKEVGVGRIATVSGRYYAMDRDKRWERTQKAYAAIVEGTGEKADSALEALESSYRKDATDEFILPTVIVPKGGDLGTVKDGDAVIFFNFRSDRSRQLTMAFVQPGFDGFVRNKVVKDLFFVTMTEYEKGLPVSATAFPSEDVAMPLGRILMENDLRQLHITETEKYPHVTYYFNGGREDPFRGEDRALISSPRVETYDLKPEMSAWGITDILLQRVKQRLYDFIIVNYANPDMVGHTGKIPASIKAVETVDQCVAKVIDAALAMGGVCLITADHGNVEELINLQTGEVDTEHSTNPVPFIVVAKEFSARNLSFGILADVAPTILGLMNIDKPATMTGRNLLG